MGVGGGVVIDDILIGFDCRGSGGEQEGRGGKRGRAVCVCVRLCRCEIVSACLQAEDGGGGGKCKRGSDNCGTRRDCRG